MSPEWHRRGFTDAWTSGAAVSTVVAVILKRKYSRYVSLTTNYEKWKRNRHRRMRRCATHAHFTRKEYTTISKSRVYFDKSWSFWTKKKMCTRLLVPTIIAKTSTVCGTEKSTSTERRRSGFQCACVTQHSHKLTPHKIQCYRCYTNTNGECWSVGVLVFYRYGWRVFVILVVFNVSL